MSEYQYVEFRAVDPPPPAPFFSMTYRNHDSLLSRRPGSSSLTPAGVGGHVAWAGERLLTLQESLINRSCESIQSLSRTMRKMNYSS